MHLSKHYGNKKYTSIVNDWALFLQIECNSIKEARYLENHIKQMKSSKYIRNLKQYPEIIIKIKERFNNPDK